MWRLWNKLFGWHYVWFKYKSTVEVTRVRAQPNNTLMFYIYDLPIGIKEAREVGAEVVPLTWNEDEQKVEEG